MPTKKQIESLLPRINAQLAAEGKTNHRFTLKKDLKPKQIENALAGFAKECRPEKLTALWDQTVLGSGKRGFVLSGEALYGKIFDTFSKDGTSGVTRVPFKNMREIRADWLTQNHKEAPNLLRVFYKDGTELVLYTSQYTSDIRFILETVRDSFPDIPEEEELQMAVVRQERQNLDSRMAKLGQSHPDTLEARYRLGNALFDAGKYMDAEQQYRSVLPYYEDLYDLEDSRRQLVLNNLAASLAKQERYGEAINLAYRVAALRERLYGPGDKRTRRSLTKLEAYYRAVHKFDEADKIAEKLKKSLEV